MGLSPSFVLHALADIGDMEDPGKVKFNSYFKVKILNYRLPSFCGFFGDVCWIMWTASAFHDEIFCIIYNDKWAMGLHINETLDNIVQWILSKGIPSVNGF